MANMKKKRGNLTDFPPSFSHVRMGRPPLNGTKTTIRIPEETRERIEALVGTYGMAKFIREAIENELARREQAAPET
jgi:predicted DNA binding CopG/RHH family protein